MRLRLFDSAALEAVRTQWGRSEDAVRTQWGRSQDAVRRQWGGSEDAVRTQWGHSEEAVRTQWGRSQDAVRTQWGGSQDAVRTQWGRSEDTVRRQWGRSEDAVRTSLSGALSSTLRFCTVGLDIVLKPLQIIINLMNPHDLSCTDVSYRFAALFLTSIKNHVYINNIWSVIWICTKCHTLVDFQSL